MVPTRPLAVVLLLGLPGLAAPENGYVDSKICASCHREIAVNYAGTGMGRSLFRPGTANTIEDYRKAPEYYHALSDSHYAVTIRNGQYFQRRWQLDAAGKEINAEELKIDYVMGSGNHARSYLHRTKRGMLIELPLGWYPDKGGEWGMVPGSDTGHPQTRRFVSYKCMFCHNGYPGIPPANKVPGSEPVYLGELPEGIDCQRCHGPGAEHVRTAGRASIVNPARLSPERPHARKKELPEAAREYAAALALKPDLARAQLHLGTVLAAEGDKEGAAAHFREAAKGNDAGVARQAEQALKDLGIR